MTPLLSPNLLSQPLSPVILSHAMLPLAKNLVFADYEILRATPSG